MLQFDSHLDAAFAALSDPTRRAIVARLCEGELSVGEIADPLPMTLSAVGQHLRILESAGLISTEKRGRTRFCEVRHSRLSQVEAWLNQRRITAEQRLDRLEDHLAWKGPDHDS